MSSIQSVVILVEICVAHQSSVVSVFLQNFSLSLCIIVQTDTPPIARLMVPASKTPPRSWHHNGTVQRPCPPAACAPSTCCTWAPLRASPDIRRRPGGCDDARAGGPRCAPAAVHVADRRGAETAGQQQVSRLLRLFPPPLSPPPAPAETVPSVASAVLSLSSTAHCAARFRLSLCLHDEHSYSICCDACADHMKIVFRLPFDI